MRSWQSRGSALKVATASKRLFGIKTLKSAAVGIWNSGRFLVVICCSCTLVSSFNRNVHQRRFFLTATLINSSRSLYIAPWKDDSYTVPRGRFAKIQQAGRG
jgi:hypothetical protein